MSHQSDWSYYKQTIKLPLVKVNPVCGDPDFRTAIFVFQQTEAGILLLAICLILTFPMLRSLWLSPVLFEVVFSVKTKEITDRCYE